MLSLILLDNVNEKDTTKALSDEFDVKVTPHLEKGVAEMCNLSEGIEKRGEKRGEERGEKRGEEKGRMKTAVNLLKHKVALDIIVQATELSETVVRKLAKANGIML